MNRIKRADIRRVAKLIGENFRPQKVYLFGSYAYGKPTRHSDVDLLVLMNTRLSNVEQAVRIRQLISLPFAADLIVRTPNQISRRLKMGDDFIKDIVTKGLVIYEAAHA